MNYNKHIIRPLTFPLLFFSRLNGVIHIVILDYELL